MDVPKSTIWFSECSAPEKILAYLNSPTLALERDTTFLDLGTGNGEMLFLLREEGNFTGNMLGVDYSPNSVELARGVANARNLDDGISFETWDVLSDTPEPGQFDVVLDKGTFDAVSLSGQMEVEKLYVRKVERLVRDGGFLLVTTCNWTEQELRNWFESGSLDYHGQIQYPVFHFGGQTGQSISSICFHKRKR
ncbi:MAG: hypothetical protein Q9191_001047 [Dirinaria sp. TL-2023a]